MKTITSLLPVGALLLLVSACRTGGSVPDPVPRAECGSVVLSELPFAELELPQSSREAPPPESVPIHGPWRYIGESRQEMHKWATELPVRPRGLFFNKVEDGMKLERNGKLVRYDRFGKSKEPMWVHDRNELVVYLPEKDEGPRDGEYVLTYPTATDRECRLNLEYAYSPCGSRKEAVKDGSPELFAWTKAPDGWNTRRGLLLPAPGKAAWDLTVPAGAELRFASGIELPELADGPPSDGATLVVEVDAGGRTDTLARIPLTTAFEQQHVDLSPYAGQKVRLRLRSDPGESTSFDYVFVAEPLLGSRVANPVRVVMVFVDTLRPDHMSLYGYERDTTAPIDHLAKDGVVFTQARSTAPWTLPSARSIITGRDPEDYFAADTLPELFHQHGYATAMFAGNVYLADNFGMTRDWDFHRVGLWPRASETTDDALAWMAEHEGHDLLVQVHYMDTHLPYGEPESYQGKYAGPAPDALRNGFMVSDVRKAGIGNDPEAQQYVEGRYDNNVRFVADQVQRILEKLDDNDVLVLFADHGEEFWDHQGYEHGHTLYDELLHVPLVVRAPGIRAGTQVQAPVSLLDVAPTVLDLAALPIPKEMAGKSLVPLLKGDPDAARSFEDRDLAFGRMLYGADRWGVLHHHEKWITTEGTEVLYDLAADPRERKNQLRGDDGTRGAPYRQYLGEALDRQVVSAYRLVPSGYRGGGKKKIPGLWVACTVPGGFSAAWKADDPEHNSEALVDREVDAEKLRADLDAFGFPDHPVTPGEKGLEVCWGAGYPGGREVYVGPANPLAEVGHELRCSAYLGDEDGGTRAEIVIPADRDPSLGADRTPLAKVNLDQRSLALEFGIAPVPNADTEALVGADSELSGMLQALGYASNDGAPVEVTCTPPSDP